MTFVPVFYITVHVGCYAGGPSELCHKCVTYTWWTLMTNWEEWNW